MMPRSTRCPKCDSAVSEGFIFDEGYGTYGVSKWQAGAPKKSFWTGIKRRKADQLNVTTHRCDRCGFLESYALPQ